MRAFSIPKVPWEKAVKTFAAFALAFSFIPISTMASTAEAATTQTIKVTQGKRCDYATYGLGDTGTFKYEVKTKGGITGPAYCVQPTHDPATGGTFSISRMKNDDVFSAVMFYSSYEYVSAYNQNRNDSEKLQTYWQATGRTQYSSDEKWIISHVALSTCISSAKYKIPRSQWKDRCSTKCLNEADAMIKWCRSKTLPTNTGMKFNGKAISEFQTNNSILVKVPVSESLSNFVKQEAVDPSSGLNTPENQYLASDDFKYTATDPDNTLSFNLPSDWSLWEKKSSGYEKVFDGGVSAMIDPGHTYKLVSANSAANWGESYPSRFKLEMTARTNLRFSCYIAAPKAKNEQVLSFLDWEATPATASISGDTLNPNYITVHKSSSVPYITDDNSCYSLEGARFDIMTEEGESLGEIVTDQFGNGTSGPLYYRGEVALIETAAPHGYAVGDYDFESSPDSNTVTLEDNEQPVTYELNIEDDPQNSTVINFSKATTETMEASNMAAAIREGAIYSVDYYDQETVGDVDRTLEALGSREAKDSYIVKLDQNGELIWQGIGNTSYPYLSQSSRTPYKNIHGTYCLPIGTVIIQEMQPPTGYNLNLQKYVIHINAADSPVYDELYDWTDEDAEGFVDDEVIRRDLELTKDEEGTEQVMPKTPFLLTSRATGETHVLVTDANGDWSSASSWNRHQFRTNASDAAVDIKVTFDEAKGYYVATGKVTDESKLDPTAGCWFGTQANGTVSDPDDSRPALPYDTYDLVELRTSGANAEAQMIHRTITVDREQRLEFEGQPVPHWNGCNQIISLNLDDTYPEISTYVRDKVDNDQVVFCDESSTVVDYVEYYDLIKGDNYALKTGLVYVEDGSPVLDADGNAIEITTPLVPKRTGGTQQVEITLNTLGLAGKKILVTERLYSPDGQELASEVWENGAYSRAQMFEVKGQRIGTTLTDAADGDHSVPVDGKITLTDTIECRNLVPGKTYTAYGTLMTATTSADGHVSVQPLKRHDGSTVTGSSQFIAPEDNPCEVDVAFTFDAVDAGLFEGGKVVAYEKLYLGSNLVASHEDPSDLAQTVVVTSAEIGTTASDSDGDQSILPDTVFATDKVEYKGLKAGQTYTMTATLMVKGTDASGTATATKLLDAAGQPVTATKTFTPNDSYGTLDMEVRFDASALSDGTQVVFFEECTGNGATVAVHADPNDAGQTLTVNYPKMITLAFDGTSDEQDPTEVKAIAADAKAKVSDRITYSNLNFDGKHSYDFVTILMDAETGLPASTDGTDTAPVWAQIREVLGLTQTDHLNTGTVPVKGATAAAVTDLLDAYGMKGKVAWGTTTITPTKADGEVTVTLPINASELAEKNLVVYEFMFANGTAIDGTTPASTLIAAENDSANEQQTVAVGGISIATRAKDTTDGDKSVLASTKTSVTDEVDYTGLVPGTEYILVGTLYNRATNEPFLSNDEPVTVEKSFVPNSSNSCVSVTFEDFDATGLKEGDQLVVFEKLYKNADGENVEIASHEDIDSNEQTVVVSEWDWDEEDGPVTPVTNQNPLDKTGTTTIMWIVAISMLLAGGAILLSVGLSGRRKDDGEPEKQA